MLSQPIPSSPAQCRQDTTYTWGPDDGCWYSCSAAKVGDGTARYLHPPANTSTWTVDTLGLDGPAKWTADTLGLNGPPERPVDTLGLNGRPKCLMDLPNGPWIPLGLTDLLHWPVDTFRLKEPSGYPWA